MSARHHCVVPLWQILKINVGVWYTSLLLLDHLELAEVCPLKIEKAQELILEHFGIGLLFAPISTMAEGDGEKFIIGHLLNSDVVHLLNVLQLLDGGLPVRLLVADFVSSPINIVGVPAAKDLEYLQEHPEMMIGMLVALANYALNIQAGGRQVRYDEDKLPEHMVQTGPDLWPPFECHRL